MANPAYRIFYGKYPDQLTGEIPNEQIKSVDGLQFRIEPGKPAEPKVDDISFTLVNLGWDGTERYDDAWFDGEARSQPEGAVFPLQLFWKVELTATGQHFLGIMKSKSYGKFRETVSVKVKSIMELVRSNNLRMLKPFTLENCEVNQLILCSEPGNEYPCAVDLDGNDYEHEQLTFIVEQHESQDRWIDLQNKSILRHFFGLDRLPNPDGEPIDGNTIPEGEVTNFINAFVKIGDNTILTTIKLSALKGIFQGKYQSTMRLTIFHGKNGPVELSDKTILERGRFFADDKGTPLQQFEQYTITLLEPDRGFDADIIIKQADMPARRFLFGCPVIPENGKMAIQESEKDVDRYFTPDVVTNGDVVNLFGNSLHAMKDALYGPFYNTADPQVFDISKAPDKGRWAFWADVSMFGWIDQNVSDVLVNLATLMNCYLYMNEAGRIVFHDRLWHEQYLPGDLPPDAFQVDLADIRPLGDQQQSNGFESYEIEYADRLEINNVESDESRTEVVGAGGIRSEAALRHSNLDVKSYRTYNLGVPATGNGLSLFRRSPADPAFGILDLGLNDFILTAPKQAQNFARSWTYPVTLWNIAWDMPRYPQAGIGGYFWVDWGEEKRVYFIRNITFDPDRLQHRMEVQQVGVWSG